MHSGTWSLTDEFLHHSGLGVEGACAGGPQEPQRERPQGRGVAVSPLPTLMLGEKSPVPPSTRSGQDTAQHFTRRCFFLVTLEVGVFILGVEMGKLRLGVRKLGNAQWGPGSQSLLEPGWAGPGYVLLS